MTGAPLDASHAIRWGTPRSPTFALRACRARRWGVMDRLIASLVAHLSRLYFSRVMRDGSA